EVTSSV
nr:Chain D, C-terminal SV motif [Homo sapiens]